MMGITKRQVERDRTRACGRSGFHWCGEGFCAGPTPCDRATCLPDDRILHPDSELLDCKRGCPDCWHGCGRQKHSHSHGDEQADRTVFLSDDPPEGLHSPEFYEALRWKKGDPQEPPAILLEEQHRDPPPLWPEEPGD
jgi:hypothetical protein